MKILIKPDPQYMEQLEILLQLNTMGHQVRFASGPLYLEYTHNSYDCLITGESNFSTEERQIIDKYNLISLIINEREISFSSKKSTDYYTLSRFANIFKYRPTLPDTKLASDIFIYCSNQNYVEKAIQITEIKNKKIKLSAPSLIHCKNFIGVINLEELTKLAHSANIVYTDNRILIDSLLYNKVLTFHIDQYLIPTDNIDKEKYILEQQRIIQPSNKIVEMINEKLSNINR
jgi:hypothetical protein